MLTWIAGLFLDGKCPYTGGFWDDMKTISITLVIVHPKFNSYMGFGQCETNQYNRGDDVGKLIGEKVQWNLGHRKLNIESRRD